ncbi:MAG: signal peptidase I [Patescibacteria group bacterium]
MSPEEKVRTLGSEAREIVRVLLISLAVVIPVRIFIAQPFIVRGASMEPTYHDGEYLIVDEISLRFQELARGEVVIFRYPIDPKNFFIKRIIGLPQETIVIRDGHVYLSKPEGDLELIDDSYLSPEVLTLPDKVVTLGPDEYFVLGDNRPDSSDSRIWGPLEEQYIVGRTFLRLWPPQRFTFL